MFIEFKWYSCATQSVVRFVKGSYHGKLEGENPKIYPPSVPNHSLHGFRCTDHSDPSEMTDGDGKTGFGSRIVECK